MAARGCPEGRRPARPRTALLSLAAVAALTFVPLLQGADAMDIAEEETLSPGAYFYFEIVRGVGSNGSDMDLEWESTATIDVWLLTSAEFDSFEASHEFSSELQQVGTSGSVVFNVSDDRAGDAPFYLVFDNTAAGPTAPPTSGAESAAYLSLAGETRMNGWRGGKNYANPDAASLGPIVAAVGLAVPVALLVLFLVLRKKKRERLAAVRRQMEAGPQGAGTAPQAAGSPPGVPGAAGPAAAATAAAPALAPAAAPPPRFCGECGRPLRPGAAFCGECGSPV